MVNNIVMWLLLLLLLVVLALSSSGGGAGRLLLSNTSTTIIVTASSLSSSSSSSLWPQKRRALLLFGNAPHGLDHYQQQQQHCDSHPLFSCYRLTEDGEICNNNNNSPLLHLLTSIRGGGTAAAAAQQQKDHDDESDIDQQQQQQHQQHPEQGGEDDGTPPSTTTSNTPTSNTLLPVKIHISTGLHSSLIDQHVEFTSSSKRTLSSLKQAISKTMPGRPPISCIQLRYRGRLLLEEEDEDSTITVNDILSHDDDDDEDDDYENNQDNHDDDQDNDEDSIKLSLTCDILPPIDSKFGIEFRNKIVSLSTKEIIEAYCLNMAGMMYGQEEQQQYLSSNNDHWGGGREDDEHVPTATIGKDPSLNIRKRAAFLQKQLFESMFTEETKQLIEDEHARVMMKRKENLGGDGEAAPEGRGEEEEEVVFGLIHPTTRSNAIRSMGGGMSKGGRKASKGGAAMNVKKALQKNLNVNWADTTRNSLLFLFFGYFGGRNSFSRTFLLLSSPLCFFLQTRPVKVAMKQLFYTIGEPPGIFLSLLPAPQQAIMSCDYGGVMKGLYGEDTLEGEEWLEMERLEAEAEEENERNDGDDGDMDCNFDDDDNEYDQYDNEADSDGDY